METRCPLVGTRGLNTLSPEGRILDWDGSTNALLIKIVKLEGVLD